MKIHTTGFFHWVIHNCKWTGPLPSLLTTDHLTSTLLQGDKAQCWLHSSLNDLTLMTLRILDTPGSVMLGEWLWDNRKIHIGFCPSFLTQGSWDLCNSLGDKRTRVSSVLKIGLWTWFWHRVSFYKCCNFLGDRCVFCSNVGTLGGLLDEGCSLETPGQDKKLEFSALTPILWEGLRINDWLCPHEEASI